MTNLPKTPGEAYEAGLREGAKRTVERIAAEMLVGACCVKAAHLGVNDIKCISDCYAHWLQYLTEDSQ